MDMTQIAVDRELVAAINEEVSKMSLEDVRKELEFIEAEEVSKILKCGSSTVYHYAEDGIIPGGKWGTLWRFRLRSLLIFQLYKERKNAKAA